MGLFDVLFPEYQEQYMCVICGKHSNDTYKEYKVDFYNGPCTIAHRYHPGCIDKAIKNPENYQNRQVDWAIKIKSDLKREEERRGVHVSD
jgi:hypothetical protein